MSIKTIVRESLHKNGIGETIWRWLHIANINILRLLPNKTYFSRAYKKTHGVNPDFNNPKTFDEKQLWLKMYYRNPLCTKCSDKYLVREYVKECGLEHILNPLYGAYDSVNDIKWDELPDRFYIKANHMSACNVRCNNLATFDKKSAVKKLARGMKHDYSLDSREWNYHDIDRKIIAEAIIENSDGSGLIDYRFLCSYGNCEYIFVDIDTADENGTHRTDARRNVYDSDFNLIDIKVSRPNFEPSLVKKPENFDEMLKYAQILSKEFPFCRVDFYNVDSKIIFGEITFFHAGGLSKITPQEWELKFGEFINLDGLLK
ncbi:MAG: carboxylate--amine ligase [Clostridia bacterium]|nr:carboxylate--amine ligase [Clostridia bacterium]